MTIVTRAADAAFAAPYYALPTARISFADDCLGYFLLGGDDASSRKNLIVPGADLIPVNGGPVAFTAKTATCGGGRGYRTPFNVTPAAFTAIVFGDVSSANADGTGGQLTTDYTSIGSADGYSGVRILFGGGDQYTAFNTGHTAQVDTDATSPAGPWHGCMPFGGQQMQCLVESPLHLALHMEEGRQIKSWYSNAATTADATTPFSVYIGCAIAGSYARNSAALFFRRPVSFAELNRVYLEVRDDLVARGFPD